MASTHLGEISRLDLTDFSGVASITEVKHLASYNWIEASTPTIAVPGSPHLWSPPKFARPVRKDSGLIYIAQNAARHPTSPLEPLFRALYIENPSFDIGSIDVVSDRNNMRKLLSFIDPGASNRALEKFTIHVEMAGNTAIFSREETVHHEIIGPRDFIGFGHEFEKAYTRSQISDSTGHHRIISYRFGNRTFLVRHETDGYIEADAKQSVKHKDQGSDKLSNMLGSLSLSTGQKGTASVTRPPGSKLSIKNEGKVTAIESNIEIKTRAMHRPLTIDEVAPQLWVSQTTKMVRAYHFKGVFQNPTVEDMAVSIKDWEKRNQKNLQKLAALVDKILHLVKDSGAASVWIKYDAEKDRLMLSRDDGRKKLPEDLYAKWDRPTVANQVGDEGGDEGGAEVEDKGEDKGGAKVANEAKIEDKFKAVKLEDPALTPKQKEKAEGTDNASKGKEKAIPSQVPIPEDP